MIGAKDSMTRHIAFDTDRYVEHQAAAIESLGGASDVFYVESVRRSRIALRASPTPRDLEPRTPGTRAWRFQECLGEYELSPLDNNGSVESVVEGMMSMMHIDSSV